MFVPSTRETVQKLYELGLSAPEIARELDVAPTTVSYHVERLTATRDAELESLNSSSISAEGPASPTAVSHLQTRSRVAGLLAAGLKQADVAKQLRISKATVSYHARRLGIRVDQRFARRYDWSAVQRYYDAGHSVRECVAEFGFSSASWSEAVRRGAVVARPSKAPLAKLLIAGTYRGRYHLKARLIDEGLKENRCERCGVCDWRGEPLTMALHHVNGERNDNRLENLELLCPNCHSQTSTFAGRNSRSRSAPPELLSP